MEGPSRNERGIMENHGTQFFSKLPFPLFYRELLEYFSVVKKNSPQDVNSKFILWNNQNITIDGNPVFWKSWFDSSILFVHDVLNSEGNFLSLEEFQSKFIIISNSD